MIQGFIHILNKQKKADFKIKDDNIEAQISNGTLPCLQAIEYFRKIVNYTRFCFQDNQKNYELFLTELGISFHE